jgi:hypothetical protein
VATAKQRTTARKNIKKAAAAAKRERTISKLPKRTPDGARQGGRAGRAIGASEGRGLTAR